MTATPTKLDVLEALLETSKMATDLYDRIEQGDGPADGPTILKLAGLIRTLHAAHQSLVTDYVLSGRATNDFMASAARVLDSDRRDTYRAPHA